MLAALDAAWEWISPGMLAKANRREQGVLHLLHNYAHTRNAARIQRAAKHGPRLGWGRKAWKRAKLEERGTYQRRDQWKLDRSAKKVREAARRLAESVAAFTGKPCTAEDFLKGFRERTIEPPVIVFGTPMTNEAASKFKEAWNRATREAGPQPLAVIHEPVKYISMETVLEPPPLHEPMLEQMDQILSTPKHAFYEPCNPIPQIPPGYKAVPRFTEVQAIGEIATRKVLIGIDFEKER